jgi:peptide deformylase
MVREKHFVLPDWAEPEQYLLDCPGGCKYNLTYYPSEKLYEKAKEVKKFNRSIRKLVTLLERTMKVYGGVGIAAPQLDESISKRVIIANTMPMVNPEIIDYNGIQISEEGCLSIPDLTANVQRHNEITVRYKNPYGKESTMKADGIMSCIIQHEIDHLDGILFIDRLKNGDIIKTHNNLEQFGDIVVK